MRCNHGAKLLLADDALKNCQYYNQGPPGIYQFWVKMKVNITGLQHAGDLHWDEEMKDALTHT